ncbi:MAG: diguanylate cyclase [Acidimicrobiales bacterium]|nr:diguanylate cyclase [Acidimicrobiales bacterium]
MSAIAHRRRSKGSAAGARTRFGLLVPLLAGAAILAVVVAGALATGRSNLAAAKEARLRDRTEMVARFDQTGSQTYRNEVGGRYEAVAPFSPTDIDQNEMLLRAVRASPAGQELVAAAVVDRDGTVVGSRPSDLDLPTGAIDEAIDRALTGGTAVTNVFTLDGEPVWAVLNPVGLDQPWGALVMIEPLTTGWLHHLYDALGPLGTGAGGLTAIDRNGVVVASWDGSSIGEPFGDIPPTGITPEPLTTVTEVDGETVVRIATSTPGHATTLIYEQSEDALYADLVEAQQRHDRLVIGAALLAILLLVAFSSARQRALRRSEARTTELLSHARDVVLVVDGDGTLRFVSPALTTMLGYDPDDLVGARLPDLLTPHAADAVSAGIAEAVATGHCSVLGVEVAHANGRPLWFDLHLADRPHPDIDGVLVTCHEIGDRRQLEEELSFRARHDALTGLGNRATFDAALADLASGDGPLAVMMIDLDRFKQLNDNLGHDAGDAALRVIADALRQGVRASDVVCRLGGDEFGVITPNTDVAQAVQLAERLVDRVEDAWPPIEDTVRLGASIGVVTAHAPIHHPERLLRDADSAMYQAKLRGGSQVESVEASPEPPGRSHRSSSTDDDADADADHADADADHATNDADHTTNDAEVETVVEHSRTAAAGPVQPHRRRRRHGAVTWGLTLVVAVAVVAAGVSRSEARIDELEQDRISDRTAVSSAIAENVAALVDLEALIPLVASTPWPFEESPAIVDYVLSRYADTGALGDGALAAVATRDGTVVASHPSGTHLAIEPDDELWQEAFDGTPYASPLTHDGTNPRIYYVIPITTDDPIELVLVMGADPTQTSWSEPLATLGALSPGPGGLSIVDVNGVAASSWDESLVGEQLIDPADLTTVDRDVPFVDRDGGDDGDQVHIAVEIPDSHSPTFAVWTQSHASLFGDLHAGQRPRDVALVVVLLIAFAGLTFVNHRRERQLRRSDELIDTLLQEAHDVLVVTSPELKVRFVSAAASRHLGVDRHSLVDRPLDDLLGAEASEAVAAQVADASPGQSFAVDRVMVPASDGTERHFDIDIADLCRHPGIGGYLLTCHEVGDRTKLEVLLSRLASRDPLTGLVNRAQFGVHLDELSGRRETQTGTDAVVFVDLDHFKPVNDEFGHQAGDHLLQIIATRFEEAVRAEDIVCRLGGDEFALLLTDCDLETAEATVQRLLATIRHPVALDQGVVALDASIGVALSHHDITNAEQLVREADQAMYAAKRAGRGRYVLEP